MPRPSASAARVRARAQLASLSCRRDDLLGADHPVALLGLVHGAEQPAGSGVELPAAHRTAAARLAAAGQRHVPELPRRAMSAGHRQAAGQQHPADAGRGVQVQGDGDPPQDAAAGLGQAGQRRVVAGQDQVLIALIARAAEDGGHVDVLPVRQGRLHHLAGAHRRGDRDPDAHHAVAELAAADVQPGRDVGQHAGTRTRLPLMAVEDGAPPGQLEGGHGKRVVPQVDRQRDRSRAGAPRARRSAGPGYAAP